MDEALAEALALAAVQRRRLESGDVDGYLAAQPEYGALCRMVARGAKESDRPALERLLALDGEIAVLLMDAKDVAGRKLMSLSQGGRANAAYLAHVSQSRRAPLFEA